MQYKHIGVLGLVLLIISRLMMMNGTEFIMSQKPFDFAHLLMLFGAVLVLAFIPVFPKNIFNTIATPLMILGAIAHVGMCTIDFVFWSYGEDYQSRDALLGHLRNTPSIWLSFFVIGPALLFAGLATQAWHFILRRLVIAIATILGSLTIGMGQFLWRNEMIVIGGYLVFSTGLALLAYGKRDAEAVSHA